jgi:hypothetical protein
MHWIMDRFPAKSHSNHPASDGGYKQPVWRSDSSHVSSMTKRKYANSRQAGFRFFRSEHEVSKKPGRRLRVDGPMTPAG